MQPLSFILPVLYAIFIWWFTTGLVIAVYGQSRRVVHICFAAATVMLVAALWGLIATRGSLDTRSVYIAYTCGVIIWGWQTASYYLGFVTGPAAAQNVSNDTLAQQGTSLFTRFRLALRASLYHELLVAGFALLIAGLTITSANRWGLWIFLALWLMHSSAKLNVFLGVRNFRIDYLPPHLHHLEKLLGKRSSNLLFLISITAAPSIALALLYQAISPGTPPAQTTGLLMVTTMLVLGILEHLLLVLPLPVTLWGWGLRALSPPGEEAGKSAQQTQKLPLRAMPEQIVKG